MTGGAAEQTEVPQMCLTGEPQAASPSPCVAAAQADAFLSVLAAADAAELTVAEQAECLLRLEQAESRLVAARASVLAAFAAQGGYRDDGQGSARAWLAWRARITRAAAAASTGWARRLAAHASVRQALASGAISVSWARQICDWTDKLPDESRADADAILLAAATAGASLADLAGLAEEMRRRTARPDQDRDDDGFAGRWFRLTRHWRGAAKVDGELTPQAAAALAAVLAALGKKAGPEDTRSQAQRDHDAIEEACRRLVASDCLPDRAGQPTRIQLHMTLNQLLDPAGTSSSGEREDPAAWPVHGLAPAGPGADCDATIIPVVTGHPDSSVLGDLTQAWLNAAHSGLVPGTTTATGGAAAGSSDATAATDIGMSHLASCGQDTTDGTGRPRYDPSPEGLALLRDTLLRRATDLLSGPTGLAAWLRASRLTGPAASVSLPLDIGTATETIPAHLRRAVTARDKGCRFPGCDQLPAACQPHHLIPRSRGGPTSLANLLSLCSFHHLIAIHRWGWHITLHGDGTVTATSPDRSRTYGSHDPPGRGSDSQAA